MSETLTQQSHKPIPGPMPHSDEWYALRTMRATDDRPVILGASEAAAYFGVDYSAYDEDGVSGISPYCSPLQFFLEKRGVMKKEFTPAQLTKMKIGLALEPIIIELYEQETGISVDAAQPMYFHPSVPWMAATPDGAADWPQGVRGIECKDTDFRMYDRTGCNSDKFGVEGSDQVPAVYFLQVQHQMAVMGWDQVDLPVLFDKSILRIYTVDRDDTVIESLIEAGNRMVERILSDDEPNPDWYHENTKAVLTVLYGFDRDKSCVAMPQSIADLVDQTRVISKQIADLEKEATAQKNQILAAFQGATKAELPDGRKLSRTVVADSIVTDADVLKFAGKVGQVGRRGHERLNLPRT